MKCSFPTHTEVNINMGILYLLSFACLVSAVSAQVCPPTEVVFVLGLSENAYEATESSTGDFEILQDAITSFLTHQKVSGSPNPFRVGAYGYSSSNGNKEIIPMGSTPQNALNGVSNINTPLPAGSWTYKGLEQITTAPTYSNNLLVVISSQGSGTSSRRARAENETARVMGLGWKPYVIAVQGDNDLDLVELTIVNNGIPPVILNDNSRENSSYALLNEEFNTIINNNLCNFIPTTTANPDEVCPPSEFMFLLDQSENAERASSSSDTTTPFDILQDAVRSFLTDPKVTKSQNSIRIGAYGYSSSVGNKEIFPAGSTPQDALSRVSDIGTFTPAGSWTYKGLEQITSAPSYSHNLLVVISSQGSSSRSKMAKAEAETTRVMELGWKPYVIAVHGLNPVNMPELTSVNNGTHPVVLENSQGMNNYTLLNGEFANLINTFLCD